MSDKIEVTEEQAEEWISRNFDRHPDGSMSAPKAEARATAGAVEPPKVNGVDAYWAGVHDGQHKSVGGAAGAVEPRQHALYDCGGKGHGSDASEVQWCHDCTPHAGAAGAVEGADDRPSVERDNIAALIVQFGYPTLGITPTVQAAAKLASIIVMRRGRATTPEAPAPEREYSGLGEWGKKRGVSRTNPFAGRTINVVADTPEAPASPPPLDVERLAAACARVGLNLSGIPIRAIARQYAALASAAPSEPGEQ